MPIIDEATIRRAASMLQREAPGSQIVLFGSYARGDMHEGSDLEFLVIEPEVSSRHDEMVRLRDALRPLRIPVDILVTSRKTFEAWSNRPGTVLYEAAKEGRAFDGAE